MRLSAAELLSAYNMNERTYTKVITDDMFILAFRARNQHRPEMIALLCDAMR